MRFLGDDHLKQPVFQNLVQAYANTASGRRSLGLRPNVPKDRSVIGVGCNRVTYLADQKYPGWLGARRQLWESYRSGRPPQLTTVFNTYPKYSHRLQALQEGVRNTYVDSLVGAYTRWRRHGLPLIHGIGPRPAYADETTFLSDPSPETTTTDGYAGSSSSNQTYQFHREAAGNVFLDSASTFYTMYLASNAGSPLYSTLYRGIMLFNTSIIGAGGVVSAATFSGYGAAKSDPGGWAPACNVYGSAPASNTGLTGADYSTVGTTAYATEIAYASLTVSGWTDWTINATGRAAIAVDGITKYGTRDSTYDAPDTDPTWSASAVMKYHIYAAELGGEGFDLKLVVTYTPGASGSLAHVNLALLGVG